jgi:AraC-like DNA-binding protein
MLGPLELALDLRNILSELRSRNYMPGSETLALGRDIFRATEHGYRRIDDHSLLHAMNFEAGESYGLVHARTDLVCFQILVNGSYSRFVADRIDAVTSNTVLISNYPQSRSDVAAGMKLRGVLIAVEREYLIDHFMLNLDNVPAAYRPLFMKKTGLAAALKLPATIAAITATDQLLSCKFGEPLRSIYLQSKATELICEIVAQINALPMRGPLRRRGPDGKSLAVEAAAAIYRREVANPPTIEQLAARVGLNRNDLTKGFRDLFGKTPHAYGNTLRMEQARILLGYGQLSISEVARQVGYDAYSGFARAFHSHFGRPPSLVNDAPAAGAPGDISPAATPAGPAGQQGGDRPAAARSIP